MKLRSVVAALVVALAGTVIPAQASSRHHRSSPRHHRGAIAGLRAPVLQNPSNDASVQSMPAFEWAPVAHAAYYQFQIAADPEFRAVIEASTGRGAFDTHNTAAALDEAVPDGVYWWRVRALSSKDSAGPWSTAHRLTKSWTIAPQLVGPNATIVDWPSQPLVFNWTTVPYAFKYLLTVATDPGLAHPVIGSTSQPIETQATVYTPSAPLTPGIYFWAVTPIDAKGHRGARSQIASFTYDWPTATTANVTDLQPSSGTGIFDPQFSWTPVAGAAHYEVEVNSSESFSPGSKWCCEHTAIGTSLAPEKVLANNSQYYWRVRAVDSRGDAGAWNYGPAFEKAFDAQTPSIPNLTVRNIQGQALSDVPAATDTPIVTWDAVPGASLYEVQIMSYQSGLGCDLSKVASYQTATTAWTPLGKPLNDHIGPAAWPKAQEESVPLAAGGAEYCVRVLARSDDDAQKGQVVSPWTQVNGPNQPAFKYEDPNTVTVSNPTEAYIQPLSGTVTPRTPLFTWKPVAGAEGYYVIVSRDSNFTNVADVGYTNVPAYAPRLANEEPLRDDTAAYHWAILPAVNANGNGVYANPEEDDPQTFTKWSIPPTSLSPEEGAVVSAQPTFRWTAAEGARNYELQVATDPSFSVRLEDVTTDATAFTSLSTYPANTTLYWRVRGNDWNKVGMNWSATKTFVRTLPVPVPAPGNPIDGEPIPLLGWGPVQGATGYEVRVDKVDGSTQSFSLAAPAFTPVAWYGVGVWRWEVRANFPTVGQPATSGYSAPVQFVRTLGAPSGAVGIKTGTRLLILWSPDPQAKQYVVDVSTTDGFTTMVDSHRTDNTSWAPYGVDLTKAQNRGRLYWRVAAIDGLGNVGAFATGSFGKPIKPACKSVKRKAKGRRVTVRHCSASSHKSRRASKR